MGFESLFGETAGLAARMAAALAAVLALILAGGWLLKRFGPDRLGGAGATRGRLGIVAVTQLDARRRLVLIRRDGVEHLILIGGPNDLLVESGIAPGGEKPEAKP